jgi:hypothetical protein
MDLVRDGDKHRALLEELNRDAQEIANDVNELLSSLGAKMNEVQCF